MRSPFHLTAGTGPLVAAAIHAGHDLRPEVAERIALSESERLREEDPYTDFWTDIASSRIVAHRSRFEVDLNRPRELAVYRLPEHAWGLDVWRGEPPEELVASSLAIYDAFYAEVEALLRAAEALHGRFLVLDLHSYNHRRDGPEAPFADPTANPDINLGTGSMPRKRWEPVVSAFLETVACHEHFGRHLEVGENIRFLGGHFPSWVHQTFPQSGCALAIEVKKFFMDEWSGTLDSRQLDELRELLAAAAAAAQEALAQC